MFKNSSGSVFYGMHFCPGVAEYSDPGKDAFRIFVNEQTIRKMNPSFAGKPVFVDHVDDVEEDLDSLRGEADGWVMESFFNAADGKTWTKFIAVTKRALVAIQRGYRLSNAYVPTSFGKGGLWNGVPYQKEVTDGAFEHLAIVQNPRYEESRILTPEEFRAYNEEKMLELTRIANSKTETGEENKMKLNFFKRKVEKLENSADFEGLSVTLPKSGLEKTIVQIVNEADEAAMKEKSKEPKMANDDDMVAMGDSTMTIGDVVKKLAALQAELDALKADMNDATDDADEDSGVDAEMGLENDDDGMDDVMENADESEKDKKDLKDAKKPEVEAKKKNSAAEATKNFDRLKNAHLRAKEEVAVVELTIDKAARGRARYGS